MTEILVFAAPSIFVFLYAGAQLIAQFALGRMYFSSTFLPELVVYAAIVAIYIYSLRHFTGKRYFAASIAGAIIGIALFVFVALLLFFRFEFPRDLSI